MVRAMSWLGRPFHPRITEFLQFLAHISTRELIAPAHGSHRLAEAFAARVASQDRCLSPGRPPAERHGRSSSG
jgi:hypothetical protein